MEWLLKLVISSTQCKWPILSKARYITDCSPSANAAIHDRNVVVDNASGSFALYDLDDGTLIRSLKTGMSPRNRRPKQVAFGEDGRIVVGGSDHGKVFVFEKATGLLLETLMASGDANVHTVTVSSSYASITSSPLTPYRLIVSIAFTLSFVLAHRLKTRACWLFGPINHNLRAIVSNKPLSRNGYKKPWAY